MGYYLVMFQPIQTSLPTLKYEHALFLAFFVPGILLRQDTFDIEWGTFSYISQYTVFLILCSLQYTMVDLGELHNSTDHLFH